MAEEEGKREGGGGVAQEEEQAKGGPTGGGPVPGEGAATAAAGGDSDGDALMSARAKLFYKKGEGFADLGVGTLKVLQSTGGDSEVQLLLRSETKLGNILMNIRVTSSVPVSTKANNLLLVSVPNPPLVLGKKKTGGGEGEGEGEGEGTSASAPVTYLVRVKTAQIAEDIHALIKDKTA